MKPTIPYQTSNAIDRAIAANRREQAKIEAVKSVGNAETATALPASDTPTGVGAITEADKTAPASAEAYGALNAAVKQTIHSALARATKMRNAGKNFDNEQARIVINSADPANVIEGEFVTITEVPAS